MSDLSYGGDIDSRRAWQVLESDPKAVLVDVRTKAECRYVGAPDLRALGKQPLFVEWQSYPDLDVNPDFAAEVESKGAPRDGTLLLLCRSGARSRAAAVLLTKLGFAHCYNIADGFEGAKDAEGHRGRAAGWKAAGLPWVQD